MITLNQLTLSIAWICFLTHPLMAQDSPRTPLQAKDENSMKYRWAGKQVLESRLLDDCENPATWKYEGMKGEMSFTTDRAKDGTHSVRLRAKTKGDGPAPGNRPWGSASVFRIVDHEDWSKWNRISCWIYPDLPGFKVVNAGIIFHNDGVRKVPGPGGAGKDYVILKNHQWNQVLCEIEYCDRDQAIGIEIQYRVQGNEPGATDVVQFDIDHIELQRVEPDKVEGWDVAPGRIAFSHVGYPAGAPKTAIASQLNADKFELINKATGKVVVSKPVRREKTPLGEYQIMDFSEVREPGSYFLQAGTVQTQEFRIDSDVWESTMLKSINFFYAMRCGYAIPGVHEVCHQDWMATVGDQKFPINGGWHDAGDLSQGLYNTADATYAMFSLAERLRSCKENPELTAQVIEEAKWGLDWLTKTSLHNGQRVFWAVMDFWTDGIVGNSDDATAGFAGNEFQIFSAASAEAIAYRVLKDEDPERAALSLKLAIEDWTFGIDCLKKSPENRPRMEWPACAVNASFDLYRATGEKKYLDQALEIAPQLIDSQERNYLPGTNMTGFFYDNPAKDEKKKYDFKGPRDINLMLALTGLIEYFPEHKDWMKWYSAVALYSEYYAKNVVKYTEPFEMLPWGISKDTTGTKISGNYYLRKFPTRQGFGQLHLTMAMADAVAVAAQTRGDLASAQLAERQIAWLTGMNPFSKSFVWGEGYDYHDYYNISGNIVGALPVGLPTHGKSDAPYWPPNALFAPTEVWVLPSLRLIHLLGEVAGPSLVEGKAKKPVQFREITTGALTTVKPEASGNFRAMIPEGLYSVTVDGAEYQVTALPCATYRIDPKLEYRVTSFASKDNPGEVNIEIQAQGKGTHQFEIRTENLRVAEPSKTVVLKSGEIRKLSWKGTVGIENSPWVAVVVPDDDVSRRREVPLIQPMATEMAHADTLKIGVAVTTRNLMKLAGPAFSVAHPEIIVSSKIKETGNVVDDVITGKGTVAVTTRNLKDYEKEKSKTIQGTPIGLDGLVVVISASIPVKSLSFEQISAVWTGKILNWKELGGPDLPITVIGRTKAYDPIKLWDDFMHLDSKPSGEGLVYTEKGKEQWSTLVAASPETDELGLELLQKTPGAITYIPLQVFYNFKAENKGLKMLDFNGITASYQTIENGEYFIHRRLNVMTNGQPVGNAKYFVDFMRSGAGQKLLQEAGFLPLEP